ncbi:exodeoxyribonuclease VII small subunit [uncultured Neglectibacter sp.]|uniref:exodeoxyribonuclease VII small subunit n=1 Tax=uncultured Neglectibacter sp. TaxID=1924108 RepID=UPI0034DF70F2
MAEKLNFEEAMARLQEIVAKLESGEESLESSMKLFEEGAKLSALCYDTLNKAEQRITELTKLREGTEDVD